MLAPALSVAVVVLASLLLLIPATRSAAQDAIETVAQVASRIDARLAELETLTRNGASSVASVTVEATARDLELLRDKTIMVFGERRQRWDAANARLGAALTELAVALRPSAERESQDDDERKAKARRAVAELVTQWAAMKSQYPEEALEEMPALWTCPMHPAVMTREASSCPICGMPLEPIYETQPQLSREPLIRMDVIAPVPLSVGTRADLRIRLSLIGDGTPVELADLEETHTRKIHLLILDLSETDYHHVHPDPAGNGEYTFSFTPLRPGPYRVWADLKPTRTRVQQFAVADIPARISHVEPAGDEPENRDAVVNGYSFHLSFETPVIHATETVRGKLHVVGPDGKPCERLEVVMGAFGHLVGFLEHSSVLHIHPLGRAIEPPDAIGGPDLDFYFRSNDAGLIRFFTQVKIAGQELFPRFIVKVLPRPQVTNLLLSTTNPLFGTVTVELPDPDIDPGQDRHTHTDSSKRA